MYTVDVTITNPDGQKATVTAAFAFVPAPTLSGVSPASGPAAGGTQVTLSGANFQPGAKVFFGAQEAQVLSVAADGASAVVVAPAYQA